MAAAWIQQELVQRRFVAQQEQSFAVGIQSANGIDLGRKAELGERAVR